MNDTRPKSLLIPETSLRIPMPAGATPPRSVRLIETYVRKPVRMWTVPVDDYIAFPTHEFYKARLVNFSNAGTATYPRWVALDRHNGYDSGAHPYYRVELAELYDYVIGSQEGFDLWMEPEVVLPPPSRGSSLMSRIVYHLSKLA